MFPETFLAYEATNFATLSSWFVPPFCLLSFADVYTFYILKRWSHIATVGSTVTLSLFCHNDWFPFVTHFIDGLRRLLLRAI
jgi:hypothetical protein